MNIRLGLLRRLRSLCRYLTATSIVLLICYAVIVVIGRQAHPYLERYQAQINLFVSEQLGIEVTTEHIDGLWAGLSPRIKLRGLRLGPKGSRETFYIQSLSAELDVLRSVIAGELVWDELKLGNLQLVLQQTVDGSWSFQGLPAFAGGGNKEQFIELVQDVLRNRVIGIDEIAAVAETYSGATVAISLSDLKLENEGDFHRLTGGFSLDDKPPSGLLIIEGRGDIASLDAFEGTAYLRLSDIEFSGSLRTIVAGWFPQLVERIGNIKPDINSEIWLNSTPGGGINLVGQLKADEIPLSWTADLPPIKNLSAELTGWYRPGQSWGLRWQGLDFDWASIDIQPLDFVFSQRLGARWGELSLAASQINLATLTEALTASGLVTSKVEQIVSTLAARGRLENLHLDLDLEKTSPLQTLRTYVDHLEVNAWAGAPATRGLSGYLEWQGSQGFFDIDSPDGFAMLYPQVYDDFMEHGSSRGRINIQWQQDSNHLKIAGGPIDIDDDKAGHARAYLSLDIPLQKGGTPEMWLLAGMRDSHSRYADQYLPRILSPALRDWLDRAVGDMDVHEAGFIWRGSLKKEDAAGRSIQLYVKVKNGELDYDPGWPALRDISAYITLDDLMLTGVIDSAKVGASDVVDLHRAVIGTLPAPSRDSGVLLSVIGDIGVPLEKGAKALLVSPLKDRVALLENWHLQGWSEVHLDLSIPLAGKKGARWEGEHYRVDVGIEQASMRQKTLGLEFESISGLLAYSDEKGLYSQGIRGSIWGQSLDGTIATTDEETRIESRGQFDTASLPVWNSLLTQYVSGISDYHVSLSIPQGASPYLLFDSSLKGIGLNFPHPLNKPPEQGPGLKGRINLGEQVQVNAQLGQTLSASLDIVNGELASGQIALGGAEARAQGKPSGLPGLSITGTTPILDLDNWLAVFQASDNLDDKGSSDTSGSPVNLLALESRFSVHFDELVYLGLLANDVDVLGAYSSEGLDVNVDGDLLAGQIKVPTDKTEPLFIDLNYLVLPEPDLDSDDNILDKLDPTRFPHLSFATEGLRLGQRELGSLAFLMRPQSDGVEISDIYGEITGITFGKLADGESTRLNWRKVDDQDHSQFSGLLKTHDLGAVLRSWRLPVVLDSEQAVSIVDLDWEGKPWEFSVNKLTGQTVLNLKGGDFFQAPSTTSNAFIKMISLINFDTWARRLRLDFSDLLVSGVAYEKLKGGLRFANGSVAFDPPIVAELPSGKMRLKGEADLLAETIDARLIATLPVGTNLPWIVALAGGLPAAAGVYLTGKLFKKQVDRVSSFSYKVVGPWDEPEVQIDKIFSDKTDD